MEVAILGGGLQGCCVALTLAYRGVRCVIFDRNRDILTKAAAANEGKVHLGYMYAADPSLATADMMIEGSLAFGPFFEKYVDIDWTRFQTSEAAHYAIHREGQHSIEAVSYYLHEVHRRLMRRAAGGTYLSRSIPSSIREWSPGDVAAEFDDRKVGAVFETPEIAVNPSALTSSLRNAVQNNSLISVETSIEITRVSSSDEKLAVHWANESASFDYVVNALWDGRLQIDLTMDLRPPRPWIHRLKYGVGFRLPDSVPMPYSTTFVSGPFGEVVSYTDRSVYLTWYPDCVRALTTELRPPDWKTYPPPALRDEIAVSTMQSMAQIVTKLEGVNTSTVSDLVVRGGPIVAWGNTDIYDPQSVLHSRYAIGVTSLGRYHSIDPGKLTMSPFFAEECADRIRPS